MVRLPGGNVPIACRVFIQRAHKTMAPIDFGAPNDTISMIDTIFTNLTDNANYRN